MKLVTTDREKELLKFVATAVTGYSRRKTSKFLGISFRRNNSRAKKVASALQEIYAIKARNWELMETEITLGFGKGHCGTPENDDLFNVESLHGSKVATAEQDRKRVLLSHFYFFAQLFVCLSCCLVHWPTPILRLLQSISLRVGSVD